MKRKIAISLSLICLILSSCNEDERNSLNKKNPTNTNPITTPKIINSSVETSNDNIENSSNFPTFVTELYQSYKSIIKNNNINLSLGEIHEEEDGNSIFYQFYLLSSYVSIHYYNNKLSSYTLELSDDDSNDELKNIITLSIAATDGISFNTAREYMQNLVNSFDGSHNSKPVKLEKYKYIIIAGKSLSLTNSLKIVPLKKENNFNKNDYQKVNSEYMQGSMNKGECASITGVVITDTEETFYNKLEIENEEGKFIIVYNAAEFAGDFEIGKTYTFYGEIAAPESKYKGCLRVDYFEEQR